MFWVTKLLNGMQRLQLLPDSRLPKTRSILEKTIKVLPSVCSDKFEAVMFTSALSLAKFGLIRGGEFTLSKR